MYQQILAVTANASSMTTRDRVIPTCRLAGAAKQSCCAVANHVTKHCQTALISANTRAMKGPALQLGLRAVRRR